MPKKRVLSGMRPTGRLHLGNYFGALKNWIKLQEEYDCFYFVADWHALTTDYDSTAELQTNIYEMVKDWLACGMDPEKSVIFRQSHVKQHAELALLLSMIVPISWLERNPTYKEMRQELANKELSTYGFLGYPVLQAADILIYKPDIVPVGEDQLPHIELCREIARRFNYIFMTNTLVEPQALLSETPKLLGIDGRKMSKSYNNCIYLSDPPEIIKEKVHRMFTDPEKIHINDPGHPEGCVVFSWHEIINPTWQQLKVICIRGDIGCMTCKSNLSELMINYLNDIQKKMQTITRDMVVEILNSGAKKATEFAEQTMKEIRAVMNIF